LITADFALEAGREVFAVPGEITSSLSSGTNALLRVGATALTTADELLEALGVEPAPPREEFVGETAASVLTALSTEPAGGNDLVAAHEHDSARVAAT